MRVCLIACVIVLLSRPTETASADRIPGVGAIGPVVRLKTGFRFTEGPAADEAGNIYFTDIPASRIYCLAVDGTLRVFEESVGTCNGLMVHRDQLLACSMEGYLLSFRLADQSRTVLADEYNGVRFNAPNDLVIDRSGGIYFTDPRFRAPRPWPQKKEAVYYRAADGTVTRVAENAFAPNGVILSPDEQTLYVVPSFEPRIWAYPVTGPGQPGNGRVLCELIGNEQGGSGGGDGLTVDTSGNLYITSDTGLQVFSADGLHLGIIEIPEKPANVTFGGPDRKTLYVTARTSVYTVRVDATGHRFPGPAAP